MEKILPFLPIIWIVGYAIGALLGILIIEKMPKVFDKISELFDSISAYLRRW